ISSGWNVYGKLICLLCGLDTDYFHHAHGGKRWLQPRHIFRGREEIWSIIGLKYMEYGNYHMLRNVMAQQDTSTSARYLLYLIVLKCCICNHTTTITLGGHSLFFFMLRLVITCIGYLKLYACVC
ncbi:hypothetical protein ACJX0J_039455, partial [Zea mays]